MSTKKKKKKPSQHQQSKVEEAQRKKYFLKKAKLIFEAAGCPNLFSEISEKDKGSLFAVRFKPIKVVSGAGDIPAGDIKYFATAIKEMLHGNKICLIENGKEISLYDYLTTGLTLYCYFKNKCEEEPKYNECLHALFYSFEEDAGKFQQLTDYCFMMCFINSNLMQQIYYTSSENLIDDNSYSRYAQIKLFKLKPPKKNIKIEGHWRTVFQVGWVFSNKKFLPALFETKKIKSDHKLHDSSYKVYVQSHALNRLSERIEDDFPGVLHLELFNAIMNSESYSLYANKIYIDYFFDDQKVGYLVGEIIANVLVIKTFLFLTHSGTPEGEKLKELTGLNKLDIKYLNIDKLTAFQESDIRENADVKELFIKAGCASLFEISKLGSCNSNMKLADKILSYLKDTRKDYSTVEELETAMQH